MHGRSAGVQDGKKKRLEKRQNVGLLFPRFILAVILTNPSQNLLPFLNYLNKCQPFPIKLHSLARCI